MITRTQITVHYETENGEVKITFKEIEKSILVFFTAVIRLNMPETMQPATVMPICSDAGLVFEMCR